MDLGAGTARPRLPHLPEVVLLVKLQDVGWIDRRLTFPELDRLLIDRQPILVVPLKNRRIESIRIQTPSVYQKLPGPADRLLDRKSTRLNSSHVAISYAV